MSFHQLGLSKPLLDALAAKNYTQATPIQSQAIPTVLTGRDLLGIAQTGTGKTAAFLLPSLDRLAAARNIPKPGQIRMLVLAPTRELASQIAAMAEAYGKNMRLSVGVIFGGVPNGKSVRTVSRGLDVLACCAWGGYESMVEEGVGFTWSRPFWEQPLWRFDAMFAGGLRAAYACARLAAPSMLAARRGLIVNVSFWAAQKYVGNTAYGVAKAATDKLSADLAHELAPHGATAVSLYPGLVRTERVLEAAAFLDLSNSESPRFTGRSG
jgi:NAD(P)-dependent dehydrogenase (short-subunit alcohol dehydrogenase family)